MKTPLTELLNIKYPIILAPMFLVSNEEMSIEAIKAGIAPCIPALNWRTIEQMREGIEKIRNAADGSIGINLIVNQSNIHYKKQLDACIDLKVDFIITSLGSPEEVIAKCKPAGIKVFCDVVDVKYAKKVEDLGADALIAVNKEAGGHCGPMLSSELIPLLKKNCSIPVISAGGVGDGVGIWKRINEDGAVGVSMGSIFIATPEAPVSQEYKQACVDYGADDIVLTTKISGSHLTVINTPYVQKVGTTQNWFEKLLSKNKKLKKYVKMLTFYKGMKAIEKAAFSSTYNSVWCAGPSIEYVKSIRPVKDIVTSLVKEYNEVNTNEEKKTAAMANSVVRRK
ncbi:MAG: nitronate monooxygenase [Bacteroidetes bacterium]|nr:nitronate monooxygenase [Bacteroidota bacterium]MCB9227641.1 nitronate monooxygenase [Chitinophagales bacterium]